MNNEYKCYSLPQLHTRKNPRKSQCRYLTIDNDETDHSLHKLTFTDHVYPNLPEIPTFKII